MIFSAQLIAQRMHGSAPAGIEADARIVGGDQEVAHQFVALGAALRRTGGTGFGNGLIAGDDHLHGLIAEHARVWRGVRRKRGFHGVHERVERAGGEHVIGQSVEQLRHEHGIVGEHLRACDSGLAT